MASHVCINGTLDSTMYSSPVPMIGYYIAAATLVCMLLMIYDTLVGIYSRKSWLPCKTFKLDSITLTLVSVAVKLTVDLTTPMPSVWDQLSKLCGTCLLCAYMGFIMPSVGVMNDSTNMYSFSILVITVFVNMCIQISTGVVVLFIREHIIILCIMLILLGMLWYYSWRMKVVMRHTRETSKNLFRRNSETVLERLKICYLYGHGSNPQFLARKELISTSVGGLNLWCLIILLQVAYRSVIAKSENFCIGNSDYDRSIPMIVVTQILTVIVGSSVSISRWFVITDDDIHGSSKIGKGEPYETNPIFVNRLFPHIHIWLFNPVILVINLFIGLITFPVPLIAPCFRKAIRLFECGSIATEEFKYLIQDRIGIDERTLGKVWREMEKEMEIRRSEPNELFQLLSKITPSQQLLSVVEHISDRVDPNGDCIPVSTLTVVLLIRIAQVSVPKYLNSSLVKTFREVYEFLCFIEENLYLTSLEFAKKLEVAKAVWLANDFRHLVVQIFDKCATGRSQFDTDLALAIIAEVKSKMPEDVIYFELRIIENYINRQQYSSVKELYDYIEQLYVAMLHVILAQFPTAMFKALITENTSEDYHDRVILALKFICKIELVEARIQWKFPQGSNLLGLITNPILPTEEEGNAAVSNHDVLPATEDTASVQRHDDGVIIEVEDLNLTVVS